MLLNGQIALHPLISSDLSGIANSRRALANGTRDICGVHIQGPCKQSARATRLRYSLAASSGRFKCRTGFRRPPTSGSLAITVWARRGHICARRPGHGEITLSIENSVCDGAIWQSQGRNAATAIGPAGTPLNSSTPIVRLEIPVCELPYETRRRSRVRPVRPTQAKNLAMPIPESKRRKIKDL